MVAAVFAEANGAHFLMAVKMQSVNRSAAEPFILVQALELPASLLPAP